LKVRLCLIRLAFRDGCRQCGSRDHGHAHHVRLRRVRAKESTSADGEGAGSYLCLMINRGRAPAHLSRHLQLGELEPSLESSCTKGNRSCDSDTRFGQCVECRLAGSAMTHPLFFCELGVNSNPQRRKIPLTCTHQRTLAGNWRPFRASSRMDWFLRRSRSSTRHPPVLETFSVWT
jgi:hypothetical protein